MCLKHLDDIRRKGFDWIGTKKTTVNNLIKSCRDNFGEEFHIWGIEGDYYNETTKLDDVQ